jgi:hypothetical protein
MPGPPLPTLRGKRGQNEIGPAERSSAGPILRFSVLLDSVAGSARAGGALTRLLPLQELAEERVALIR